MTVHGSKILVSLDPEIPHHVYNLDSDLDIVVLAPGYVGTSLTPEISGMPCIVNFCIPRQGGDWKEGPWSLLDIGEMAVVR